MTSDQAPSPRPQAPIWHRPLFWFGIALVVRLPALWFHSFRHADGLAFLYHGAALLLGRFVDLGAGLRETLPGAAYSRRNSRAKDLPLTSLPSKVILAGHAR